MQHLIPSKKKKKKKSSFFGGTNSAAFLSLQHNSDSSEHRGGWDPPVGARHDGHRADVRGAADRRHHAHRGRGLGAVSLPEVMLRAGASGS